ARRKKNRPTRGRFSSSCFSGLFCRLFAAGSLLALRCGFLLGRFLARSLLALRCSFLLALRCGFLLRCFLARSLLALRCSFPLRLLARYGFLASCRGTLFGDLLALGGCLLLRRCLALGGRLFLRGRFAFR